jgi:apolipoprotein N-acyltransferase
LLFLFCLYLAIYHGVFGLLISLLASPGKGDGTNPFDRRALLLAPFVWVAVELARTRITGFPWDLLGISQVDNIPLAHISTLTGVYGLSFEIMVVNTALAAAFALRTERGQRSRRRPLLLASAAAIVVLQAFREATGPRNISTARCGI